MAGQLDLDLLVPLQHLLGHQDQLNRDPLGTATHHQIQKLGEFIEGIELVDELLGLGEGDAEVPGLDELQTVKGLGVRFEESLVGGGKSPDFL